MITAAEYRKENKKLMEEFEESVRKYIAENGKVELAEKIPFYRDGVVDPDTWFREGNDFRPLFVLKEVSIGKDSIKELDEYNETWGHQEHFEFVEYEFDDVQVGKFNTWRRIVGLAKGLSEIHNGQEECDYYEFPYKEGEAYSGDIKGYQEYKARTNNEEYNATVKKIAILELKKIGGGKSVNSEISKHTKHYTEHAKEFQNLLKRQVELIDPTVIICCGRDGGCISQYLSEIKQYTPNIIWIDGYHPICSSNKNFYYTPLDTYRDNLNKIYT